MARPRSTQERFCIVFMVVSSVVGGG
jgi:hypothetical protein